MTTETAEFLRATLEPLGLHPAFDLLARTMDGAVGHWTYTTSTTWSWSTEATNYQAGDIISITVSVGADSLDKLVVADARMLA